MTFTNFLSVLFNQPIFLFAVLPALAMMVVNGWTDAPVVIAASVRSGVLKLRNAILLAAVCNFLGATVMVFFGGSVAVSVYSISGLASASSSVALPALVAAMLSVVVWALIALYFGLPTSESHALLAGLTGASTAIFGSSAFNFTEWIKVLIGLIVSTIPVLIITKFATFFINKRFHTSSLISKKLQICGAALSAFAHGAQDGQKFAGVLMITASLYTHNTQTAVIPIWTILLSAVLISGGTLFGGRKIISSFDNLAPRLPLAGFVSDVVSALFLVALSLIGIPTSTTHAKTCAIVGAGRAAGQTSGTKTVLNMSLSWVLTFPVCAAMSFVLCNMFNFFVKW